MESYAEDNNFPIVGPLVGSILHQITTLKRPADIFEIGSGFGYSALWFSLAAPQASIFCTEYSDKNIELAKKWCQKSGLGRNLHFHHGDAKQVLKNSTEKYDIIFNDADKIQYPEIFHTVGPHLNQQGLLISDNVLWKGKVIDEADPDSSTRGVREYNRLIFNSDDYFSTIIPVRDGISISIKR
jgi:predicted O-methyltransferase YrrM